ncbi:MAG: molybdopterin-dependent oxidoreductase [Pseudomonadales bacterium]|nr:molybdopterin-dependent oxidoreductase [Pseudomonadales bacterium]
MKAEQTHYQSCVLCEAMCGLVIQHDGTKILSIKGDKNDPFSQGYICPKAMALKDIYEDDDRIKHPLLKTDRGWQEISWQQAFDKTALAIKQIQAEYGQDAIATYLGNPNVHNTGSMLFVPWLLKALHSKNSYSATSVDQLPHQMLSYFLFGHQLQIPVPDIDRCDFFLMLGANPAASNGSLMSAPNIKKRLAAIKDRGGKIIVIDPRKTETASLASSHHFIQPGSDALLLLAMIQTLYAENLIPINAATKKLAAITLNWEQERDNIKTYVETYTPERVADKTGISADEIKHLTRDFASAQHAVCYGRMGVSTQQFGLLCQYLIMLLNILTGRLDQQGGMMFTRPAANILKAVPKGHFDRYRSRVRQRPEFSGELPVAVMAEEMLVEGSGKIKALINIAGNPVLSTPNGQQMDKALEQLDFMLAIDFYINESNRHANIILPPVSPLERDHYDLVFNLLAVRNTAKFSKALFKKPQNTQHDWQIFLQLAKRLFKGRTWRESASIKLLMMFFLKSGPKLLLDILLRTGPYSHFLGSFFSSKHLSLARLKAQPHGIDLGELSPCLPQALWHEDKTIHLNTAFFMADLQRVDDIFWGSANANSGKTKQKPFLLIGRRHIRSNNSWLHNSLRLVKGRNRCTLHIHPDDALHNGITSGQTVKVTSVSGAIELPAQITNTIKRGVLSIPHGWGHHREGIFLSTASRHAGVSINDISDETALDVLSGNAVLNGIAVSITALKNHEET